MNAGNQVTFDLTAVPREVRDDLARLLAIAVEAYFKQPGVEAVFQASGVPSIGARTVRLTLAGAPAEIGETVILTTDDGTHLRTWQKADFLRAYLDNGTLVLTQEPESVPVTEPAEPEVQSDPIGDLAEAVVGLMVEVDNHKLGVTT